MKANEVRVGNLVMDGHEIETVNARMISMLEKGEADFDGILINELDVTKLGFKSFEDGWYRLVIGNNNLTWNIYDKMIRFNGFAVAESDYVHEFQNIIYVLTGEELTNTEEV